MGNEHVPMIVGCRSEGEAFSLDADMVTILVAPRELMLADGSAGKLDGDRRRELIEASRAGKHIEIALTARTFRQHSEPGKLPNRNYIRHAPAYLPKLAASYVGMPFLLDHAKSQQRARVGTIRASELVEEKGGMFAFRKQLHVVKADAVQSVLDGTIDRFSIGWHPTGPVLCTLHKNDVRDRNSCSCWPGSKVAIDGVDRIAEYEFQRADGIEVSAVNVPAVTGTKIEDIRAALTLELNLPTKGQVTMLNRLAALLGLAALNATDEDQAIQVVGGLQSRATQADAQRDAYKLRAETAEKSLATLQTEVETERAGRLSSDVDVLIAGAYTAGKLARTKGADSKSVDDIQEPSLRALAKTGGVKFLADFLATMPTKIPLGKRVVGDDGKAKEALGTDDDEAVEGALSSVANQLGLKPDDVKNNHKAIGGNRRVVSHIGNTKTEG